MSLGVKPDITYLNIKEGKIQHNENAYNFVEGYLKNIEVKDREFRGETVKYWYVNLQDEKNNLYSLALAYRSGVAKSLFNSLASAEEFTKLLRIEPYKQDLFTKVSVYLGGERLSWKVAPLPPLEDVKVGDKIVKDDSKRMSVIVNLVNEINSKLFKET
jgi:hypothetical protein